MSRKWSIYEQNQLMNYGYWGKNLERFGEAPVEYITGHCEFDGLDFKVTKDVLIPRVESAEMLPLLEQLVWDKAEVNFAEVGAGSGAIGIALYLRLRKKSKKVMGVLSDISAEAIEVAKLNAKKLIGVTSSLSVKTSDLLKEIRSPEKFDLIFADLPYIPTSRVPRLPESVVDYEPKIALDGGPEGLTLIKKLLIQAKDRLQEDGALILEIDYSHDLPDFVDIREYQYEIIKDEFGQNRFLVARKGF